MWNSTPKPVARRDINEHYLGILRQAVQDCHEFDIRQAAVYEALDRLQKESIKSWGFTVFRRGLERPDYDLLRQGYCLICQHLGFGNALAAASDDRT
jgi:hypothetical protein